jgi:hypothetical protein
MPWPIASAGHSAPKISHVTAAISVLAVIAETLLYSDRMGHRLQAGLTPAKLPPVPRVQPIGGAPFCAPPRL